MLAAFSLDELKALSAPRVYLEFFACWILLYREKSLNSIVYVPRDKTHTKGEVHQQVLVHLSSTFCLYYQIHYMSHD